MYPSRYQLPEVSTHLLAILERRRAGFTEWNAETEAALARETQTALTEAGRQFAEVADDAAYWQRVEQAVFTVLLPRYFKVATAEHALEQQKYGLWRGGDLVSRVAYAAAGLFVAAVIWRTAIPDWLEPLPLAFFIGGPLLPDLQTWFAKRRYASKLTVLVDDMRAEAAARELYRPLMEGAPAPMTEPGATQSAAPVAVPNKGNHGQHH